VNRHFHDPAALPPGKHRTVIIVEQARRFGENKNVLLLPGIEPLFLGLPVSSLVSTPTELLPLLD
jgi:hypothetical protein